MDEALSHLLLVPYRDHFTLEAWREDYGWHEHHEFSGQSGMTVGRGGNGPGIERLLPHPRRQVLSLVPWRID